MRVHNPPDSTPHGLKHLGVIVQYCSQRFKHPLQSFRTRIWHIHRILNYFFNLVRHLIRTMIVIPTFWWLILFHHTRRPSTPSFSALGKGQLFVFALSARQTPFSFIICNYRLRFWIETILAKAKSRLVEPRSTPSALTRPLLLHVPNCVGA